MAKFGTCKLKVNIKVTDSVKGWRRFLIFIIQKIWKLNLEYDIVEE